MPFAESKRRKETTKPVISTTTSPVKDEGPVVAGWDLQTVDTASRPNIVFDASGPGGLTIAPKRKQASVVEMLEYVKGLDIDPLKEADMLWIAEEAFNAPLPPGWTEHQDERGVLYFHNTATGKSEWRHPMDDVFKEVVMYQRRVMADSGFWNVEDEIAVREEAIRHDLADWMELYDDQTEKFFYNRRTDESRFDDPRMEKYHELYARIKMIARMKERLPKLAQNKRPREPTAQEIEMERLQREEEERYLKLLIRIQSMARVIIARKKVKQAMAQAIIQKGPQPLKNRLRLRIDRGGAGGRRELVLTQTSDYRRDRAATKLQARVRGIIARKKFKPLLLHRNYLSKIVTKVQQRVRIWIAKRRMAKMRHARKVRAATSIQRIFRGWRDRRFLEGLTLERIRFKHLLKKVIVLQAGYRMHLGYKKVAKMRADRLYEKSIIMQVKAKTYIARRRVQECANLDNPLVYRFSMVQDPKGRDVAPWHFQLMCAPKTGAFTVDDYRPWVDVFSKVDPKRSVEFKKKKSQRELDAKYYHVIAITKIQALARGVLLRKKKLSNSLFVFAMVNQMAADAATSYCQRRFAATRIQKIVRGRQTRKKDIMTQKMKQYFVRKTLHIRNIQSYFSKYHAQEWLKEGMYGDRRDKAATVMQTRWRGWLARRHVEVLREKVYWPLKSWFQFNSTKAFVGGKTQDNVQMNVRFVPNPVFDDYRHFVKYGDSNELPEIVLDMQGEVDFCVDSFLADEAKRERRAARARRKKAKAKEGHDDDSGSSAASGHSSKAATPGRSASRAGTPTDPTAVSLDPSLLKVKLDSRPPSTRTKNSPRVPSSRKGNSSRREESKDSSETPAHQIQVEPKLETKQEPKPRTAPKFAPHPKNETLQSLDENAAQVEYEMPSPVPKVVSPAKNKKTTKPQPKSKLSDTARSRGTKADEEFGDEPSTILPGDSTISLTGMQTTTTLSGTKSSKKQASPSPSASQTQLPTRPSSSQGELPPVIAPVRKTMSPKPFQPTKEHKPLVEDALDSHALRLFQVAPKKYRDVTPEGCPIAARRREYEEFKKRKKETKEAEREKLKQPGGSDIPQAPVVGAPSPPVEGRASGEIKASQLKLSQSDGALPHVAATAPPARKTYGGKIVGSTFVKSNAETVADMTAAEIAECQADITQQRNAKVENLKLRREFHKQRNKEQERKKYERFQAEMNEAEAAEEERRKQKVKELKKWLKKKEADARAKKEKEAAMMQEVLEKDQKKAEAFQEIEKKRGEEREKRLRAGERQKAMLDAQLLIARAERAEKQALGLPVHDPISHLQTPSMSQEPQELIARTPGGMGQPMAGMPPMMAAPGDFPAQQQRVLHRHIHHHVHYHEGGEGEGMPPEEKANVGSGLGNHMGAPSLNSEEQRQIEMDSEARVREQLDQDGQAPIDKSQSQHFHQHVGIPKVDPGAETPTNVRRAQSMGAFTDGADRTQEAFYHGAMARPLGAEVQEIGKRRGLEKYASNVGLAFSSYADSGRPRLARHLPT